MLEVMLVLLSDVLHRASSAVIVCLTYAQAAVSFVKRSVHDAG
jgi:hypothetical protein